MSEQFEGNIPVSTAKQVFRGLSSGRNDLIKQVIADKGLPIMEEDGQPSPSNSNILYGVFPEAFAVKGLVHDVAVNQYARESDFRTLGVEPSVDEIKEIMERSIDGTGTATPELRHRVSELETVYDLHPNELLDYRFGDTDVSEMIENIAEYRFDNWQDDTADFNSINPEVSVFGKGLSGRIDLNFSGPEQIRELKMKESPSEEDIFQASAYWLITEGEPEAVLEYPLTGEKLVFDPENDENDFDPRDYAFDVYNSRDKAIELINDLRSLQTEYFDFYDSREKATREAIRELEV